MNRISILVFVYLALLASNVQCADDAVSSEVKKWKLFESRVLLERKAWETDDWNDYLEGESTYPEFSFSYPSTWKFNGSIDFFFNPDGSKAEMGPAPIKLKSNQKCFDGPKPEGGYLKDVPIRFGNLSGKKIVSKNETEPTGDIWHTYSYCLSNGDFAFTMNFWIKDLNVASEKTFDRVMSTFKFITPIPNDSERKSLGKALGN